LYTHDCDVGDNPSKHQYGTLGVSGVKRKKRSGEPPAGATVPFSLEAQHCGKASEIEGVYARPSSGLDGQKGQMNVAFLERFLQVIDCGSTFRECHADKGAMRRRNVALA
jgi:hypothetical protein